VRYSYDEFDDIEKKIRYVLKEDYNQFVDTIFSRLNSDRNFLLPYLKNDCIIQNTNDFQLYYTTLVHWRSAMNTVFTIPDMDDINTILKEKVLSLRSKSEKYTEKMNMVMVDYFESHYQNYLHISHVVTPQEVIQFDSILKDNNVIKKIESRLE
jgi:hypothetical protein